jgi:hypothetical protein
VKITEPGIYTDISSADYFADPCPTPSLTQSIAKLLLDQSPAHARLEHPRLALIAEDDEVAEKYVVAEAIGNAAHRLLTGRGREIVVGDFDNFKSGDARKFRDDPAHVGKIIILTKHMARAYRVTEEARAQLDQAGGHWREAFKFGHGEVVVAWQEHGMWFRTLIDWMGSLVFLYDLKTTGMALSPYMVGRYAADHGWDIQVAMHERGLDAVDPTNAGRRRFFFPAIENEPPYALLPIELTEPWLTMGRKKLAMAVDIWRRSITTDTWPRYTTETITPEYPSFKETQWLTREVEESERRSRSPMVTEFV